MYEILNISGGQLVCDANGKTIRLNDREKTVISRMTDYLKNIEMLGLIKCSEVKDNKSFKSKNKK